MALVRVYHPSLNSYQDIDSAQAREWTKNGWQRQPGKHIDESGWVPLDPGQPAPRRAPARPPAKTAASKTSAK